MARTLYPSELAQVVGQLLSPSDVSQLGYILFHADRFGYLSHGMRFYTKNNPNGEVVSPLENIFEIARSKYSPQLPSRKTSLFCSISLEDAVTWRNSSKSRKQSKVYRIQPLPGTRIAIMEYAWFNHASLVMQGKKEVKFVFHGNDDREREVHLAARAYWEGDVTTGLKPMIEVLCDGKLKVISDPIEI